MKCRLREDEETHFPKKAALSGSGFFREVQILFFIGSELTFTGFCLLRQMTEQLSDRLCVVSYGGRHAVSLAASSSFGSCGAGTPCGFESQTFSSSTASTSRRRRR